MHIARAPSGRRSAHLPWHLLLLILLRRVVGCREVSWCVVFCWWRARVIIRRMRRKSHMLPLLHLIQLIVSLHPLNASVLYVHFLLWVLPHASAGLAGFLHLLHLITLFIESRFEQISELWVILSKDVYELVDVSTLHQELKACFQFFIFKFHLLHLITCKSAGTYLWRRLLRFEVAVWGLFNLKSAYLWAVLYRAIASMLLRCVFGCILCFVDHDGVAFNCYAWAYAWWGLGGLVIFDTHYSIVLSESILVVLLSLFSSLIMSWIGSVIVLIAVLIMI